MVSYHVHGLPSDRFTISKKKESLCTIKHHAMKIWGNGGIAPLILHLGTGW